MRQFFILEPLSDHHRLPGVVPDKVGSICDLAAAWTCTDDVMDNGTTSSSSSSISSTNGQDHPLQQPWQLYLHYPTVTQALESYGKEAYQALCEFSTVEGFWTYFYHLPKPSDVFTEMVPGSQPAQLSRRKLDGKNLEAFGLFKKVRLTATSGRGRSAYPVGLLVPRGTWDVGFSSSFTLPQVRAYSR